MPSTRAWQAGEFNSDGSRGVHESTVCRSVESVNRITRGWYQQQEVVTTASLKGQGEEMGQLDPVRAGVIKARSLDRNYRNEGT